MAFPFLEVACMFSLILVAPARPQHRVMSFRTFPRVKKSPKVARQSESEGAR